MISFSVAVDPNNGIGIKGALPWHIKEELKLFKRNTINHNIIMGQTTYDGLPRKLVDRTIYAVSWDEGYNPEGAIVVKDLISFLKEHENDEEEFIVCGGASIYRQAYPYCKKAYVSFIKKEYEVDAKLECFDIEDWTITKEEEYEEFIYRELIRRK